MDFFNEGVDLSGGDALLVLRPTHSSVLFLQQLGHGGERAPLERRLYNTSSHPAM